MGLSEIASGITITTEQRTRSVATIDVTNSSLYERIAPFDESLPCSVSAAVTLVETYAAGNSVGDSSREAGLVPIRGAKTLHLLGEPITVVSPTERRVIESWIDAEILRTEAMALIDVTPAEFSLAVFIATHDPLPGIREALEPVLTPKSVTDATVTKRDSLAETMSGPTDLQ
ncbi:DUF7858 family protein [Halocatena halophila]|uniref:DUF7858 family protein n=1 Tax=Halocatena halophila TaxID=2814576 RepID=UPI002ED661C3